MRVQAAGVSSERLSDGLAKPTGKAGVADGRCARSHVARQIMARSRRLNDDIGSDKKAQKPNATSTNEQGADADLPLTAPPPRRIVPQGMRGAPLKQIPY